MASGEVHRTQLAHERTYLAWWRTGLAGIAAGFLDEKGERTSVFTKDSGGIPRLVLAMLARHDEENGGETGPVRGMPLGYDPLPLEDIQLVDSRIAQGRPR